MRIMLWVLATGLYVFASTSARADAAVEQDTVVAQVDSDGVQRVRVIGGEYFFKPKHIVVKANVPVELVVSKEPGMAPHTLVINAPEAGIVLDEELDTEPKRLVFTPHVAGSYPYYCRNRLLFFKSHREQGMEGVLEVAP